MFGAERNENIEIVLRFHAATTVLVSARWLKEEHKESHTSAEDGGRISPAALMPQIF